MYRALFLLSALFGLSSESYADTLDTERLSDISKSYARCAQAAIGNFKSDEESQKAMKVFYRAMITNAYMMIDLGKESNSESFQFLNEVMRREMLAGYFLRSFFEKDPKDETKLRDLLITYKLDIGLVNKQLWSDWGCSAIYEGLK